MNDPLGGPDPPRTLRRVASQSRYEGYRVGLEGDALVDEVVKVAKKVRDLTKITDGLGARALNGRLDPHLTTRS